LTTPRRRGGYGPAPSRPGNADGRFQFPAQSSAAQRAGRASAVHFVVSALAVDRKANVVVLGDLNDYQFSPALSVLRIDRAVFNGVSQVLDHILVTPGVRGDPQVVRLRP